MRLGGSFKEGDVIWFMVLLTTWVKQQLLPHGSDGFFLLAADKVKTLFKQTWIHPTYHRVMEWKAVSLPPLLHGPVCSAVQYDSKPWEFRGQIHRAALCLHKAMSVLGAITQWCDSGSSWKQHCLSRRWPQLLQHAVLPCLERAGATTVQHAGKWDYELAAVVLVQAVHYVWAVPTSGIWAFGSVCGRDKGGSCGEHVPSALASPFLMRIPSKQGFCIPSCSQPQQQMRGGNLPSFMVPQWKISRTHQSISPG